MSRGLLGFVAGGRLVASYVHDAAYPGGVGLDVLTWLHKVVWERRVVHERRRVLVLTQVHNGGPLSRPPLPDEVDRLRPWTDLTVGAMAGLQPSWYQLLRKTQGDPDAILTAGYIEDWTHLALESSTVEWAWVVDFDGQALEVYQGGDSPATAGRWAGQTDPTGEPAINLARTYYFGDLPDPDQFVAELDPPEPGDD